MAPLVTESILTIQNVMFFVFALGTIFGVYNYFKKPQDENDINKVVTEKDLGTKATILAQKEAEGKASLLAQQVQTEKEYNTKKFIELGDRFDKTDLRIEVLTESVNDMNLSLTKQLTRVVTIVEEHQKNK